MIAIGLTRDRSITALSGASQVALPLNGNRQFLLVQNVGANPVGLNVTGGPAVIGATGTLVLAPNEKWPASANPWVPQNAVNVTGTAGQPVVILEG